MSTTAPAVTSTAQANAAAGRNQAPTVPFPQASRRAREQPLSFTLTPGTATITVGPADLTPNGFLRFVDIHVHTVTAATETPVAAAGYPWTILENIQFIDTGGQKMDDLSGYALYVDNYASGSPGRCDPAAAYDYSASVSAPNFRLRIARELFPDGRGSLPNLSGSQKYRIRLVVDATSNIWSSLDGGTAPTLQIDIIDHLWLLPQPTDAGGRPQQRKPNLLGLAQYRTGFYPAVGINNAQVNYQIKATGTLIKYIAMIARDSGGAFNDLVFPDPFTLRVDNSYPYDNVPLSEVIHEYESMIPERVARLTGVILLPFNYGLGRWVGDNGVASWEPTSTATYINLQGRQATPTVGTIDFLVCEISTAEIDPAERAAMGNATGTWQPAIPANVQGGV